MLAQRDVKGDAMAEPATDAAVTRSPAPVDDLGLDPWQLHGMPGGLLIASYLTGRDTAAQYRAIVDVMVDHQQEALHGLDLDELALLLRQYVAGTAGEVAARRLVADLPLAQRMDSLATWGVVTKWDDRTGAAELTDWNRNSARYVLTVQGAQFHRAVKRLGERSAAAVAATFAPGVLRAQLELMCANLGTNPGAVTEAWAVVSTTLDAMVEAAADWQAQLAQALVGPADDEKVQTLQQILGRYVDMWGAGVDTHSAALAGHADQLLAAAPDLWREVAVHALEVGAEEERVGELASSYLQTVRAVRSWFAAPADQARRLRRQMRDAIAPMVRSQRTLAAGGGHVSRRAELLSLAAGLEACPDDDRAWRLWCTATGLFAARHLPLHSDLPAGAPGSVSFWDAEPTKVEARLREQGTRAATGRPARMSDRSAGRAAARAAAEARRRAAEATTYALRSRSGTRLSTWQQVDTAQLDALLGMLAELNAVHADPHRVREARTADGLWVLRSDPPEHGAPDAVIHTDDGRLVVPDVRLTMTSTSPTAAVP
ncbi:MAG: DUF2397 domain-containing protein [Angustibacter sp.]